MNLLGKILTGVIFVLSLIFATVALMVGAADKNWQVAANNFKAERDALASQNESLKATLTDAETALKQEQSARAIEIARLMTELSQIKGQLVAKETQLAEVTRESQSALAELKQSNARLAELDERVSALSTENVDLQEDIAAQSTQVATLLAQLQQIQSEKSTLDERAKQLSGQLATAMRVMTSANLSLDQEITEFPPKDLTGRVQEVSRKIVVLSLGKDDGLRVGHQFDVVRNGQFKGRVEVVGIEPNRVTAKIVDDLTKSPLQVDDAVVAYIPKG
jgi:myosin heavy subunit